MVFNISDLAKVYKAKEQGLTFEQIVDEIEMTKNDGLAFNRVARSTCSIMMIDYDSIFKKSRKDHLVLARHVISYVMNKKGRMSLTEIGKEFGNTHATILHGVRRIEIALKVGYKDIAELVESVEESIKYEPISNLQL